MIEDYLITLTTFYNPLQAEIVKTRLESEGIPCFLTDGNLLPSLSFFSDEGGVKLKIHKQDFDRAKQIIGDELNRNSEL